MLADNAKQRHSTIGWSAGKTLYVLHGSPVCAKSSIMETRYVVRPTNVGS
jgi:hypothetical protein